MHRFTHACCVLMAGALAVSVLAVTGCHKNEKPISDNSHVEDADLDQEGKETENDVSVSGGKSDVTYQDTRSKVEQDAIDLATSLGVTEDELHGKYELFLKYADCVVNNPKLGEYRAYALHMFPVVADHLTSENEEYFLSKLRDLKMESLYTSGAAGEFYSMDDMIRIFGDGIVYENEATYTTIFHELTHFVDAYVDGEEGHGFYLVDDHLYGPEEMPTEAWENDLDFYNTIFITEGGAELYMGKYFSKDPQTYTYDHMFLTGFEWIFGSQALDDLFFGSDTTQQFVGYLRDIGYSDTQIADVLRSFNYFTYNYENAPEGAVRYEDVLIDLYEHGKGDNWKEDPVFCHILRQINLSFYFSEVPLKHQELTDVLLSQSQMQEWTDSVMKQLFTGTNPDISGSFYVLILDGEPYLAADLERTEEIDTSRPTTLLVDYDFNNGKVQSYDYIVHPYPQTIPEVASSDQALTEKFSSLEHDHTALHSQTPYSGRADLAELYERAARIGNEYGVYIRLGEDVPSYVQTYANSLEGYEFSPESIQNMSTLLDQVEEILKKFPKGYFDQLDYGYYGGFEISIVEFASNNEMTVQYADDKYLMSFSMDCKAASDLLVEQDCRLMEAIFAATDKKLINYFENYEDPMFSESIWKELNPEDFYYHGYQDADYERFNDYVVCYDGLRCAPKDRATLMESLMEPYAIPGPCLKKAEFYSRCIRQAFDDSSWPEKTAWEEEITVQKGKQA